ncbi:hypothetical protein [Thalassotalea fusca]
MFKKSLVALAIASVSATTLAAADIKTNTTPRVISEEGSASLTNVQANQVQVVLGAEYAVGDILTFTFAGASLDTTASTLPASVNPVLADTNDTMTLGLLNATSTTLTYRVTELTFDGLAAETTVGAALTFADGDLQFTAASVLASGAATVTFDAKTSTDIVIDSGTKSTAEIFDVASQFSASVTTGMDAVIDVNDQRLSFTGVLNNDTSDNVTTDDVVLTSVNTTTRASDSTAYDYVATATAYTYTIYGDFSILDTDADTAGVQTSNVTVAPGTASLTSVAADKIVVSNTAVGATTVTVDVEGDTSGEAFDALATQSFTADASVAYTDHGTNVDPATVTAAVAGTKQLASGANAGAWTLNGANVTVPYMPFGPDTKVILRATNTGSQTGAMTVRYLLEGSTDGWQTLDVAVADIAPGVTNIRDVVMNAIMADAGVEKGKVAIDLTVNAPSTDITVYAAFRVVSENDRGFVGTFGALGAAQD